MKIDFRKVRDNNGRVMVNKLNSCYLSSVKVSGHYAENWMQIFDGERILTKELIEDKPGAHVEKDLNREYQYSEFNAILTPYILRQIGIDTAEYYLGSRWTKNLIVTPSFLKEDEKLIGGDEIMATPFDPYVPYILETLTEDYGENVANEFLIQTFASKFINQTDEKNTNWGVIYNKKTKEYRMAPMFDFDMAGVTDTNFTRRYAEKEYESTLSDFYYYYGHFPFIRAFLEGILTNFNLEKAISDCEKDHFVKFSLEDKKAYATLYAENINTIRYLLSNENTYKKSTTSSPTIKQ